MCLDTHKSTWDSQFQVAIKRLVMLKDLEPVELDSWVPRSSPDGVLRS